MNTLKVAVFTTEGKIKEEIKLDNSIFSGKIRTSSVFQTVNSYMSNQRKGLACTKTRGEVSGGGCKPWRQKGTGRARVGSSRSPLWRHGGVTFGPKPRDFSVTVPKKIRTLALLSAVTFKISENNLVVLDDVKFESAKTKDAVKIFTSLNIDPKKTKVLLLLDKIEENVKRSLKNVKNLTINIGKNTNAYEVLNAEKLVVTKKVFGELEARLKK